MKINNVQFPVFNPYSKPTYEIYVAGCLNACPECHLKELWDFDNGEEVTDGFFKKMEDRRDWFDCISVLGGDLLYQDDKEAHCFCSNLKFHFSDKEFWLFTGKDFSEVPKWCFQYFDVIKCGKYIKELKQERFPASSNQKVYRRGKDY
jgi:hypothetical protein